MNKIGEKLKELREVKGFTRKEVAERLEKFGINISEKTLYGYESGRNSANADMFLALCEIYGCTDIIETFGDATDDAPYTVEEDPPGKQSPGLHRPLFSARYRISVDRSRNRC